MSVRTIIEAEYDRLTNLADKHPDTARCLRLAFEAAERGERKHRALAPAGTPKPKLPVKVAAQYFVVKFTHDTIKDTRSLNTLADMAGMREDAVWSAILRCALLKNGNWQSWPEEQEERFNAIDYVRDIA